MAIDVFALKNGTELNGRFVVKNVLGSGGFGITYEVFDRASGKNYAIKEYYPKDISVRVPDSTDIVPASDNYIKLYDHGKERFLEEADYLQTLNKIPGVVNVYDFFLQNGTCYFVMERLYGKPLSKIRCDNGGRLTWEQLKPYIEKAGKALISVHSKGIFHRDAKPDNIFVLENGDVKLIDFGSAKNLIRKDGEKLSVYMTPGFAPPEQYSSSGVQGTFTDVYTIGASIYYMLVGKKLPDPFSIQSNGYAKLSTFGVEQYVSDAVDKALKLRAKERTQTINELLFNLRIGGRPKAIPFVIVRINGQIVDRYKLNVNTTYTIGRFAETSNISIDDNRVSRIHCEVFYDTISNEFYVVDHSMNGTYIGGARVERENVCRVKLGTCLYLGGPRCQIELGVIYER